MLSNLRTLISDIHADSIDDAIFGLKVWKLAVEDLACRGNIHDSIEATLATLLLANLTLSLEVYGLYEVAKHQWPHDLDGRLSFINDDLAKAELLLKKLLNLLEGLEDQKYYVLKAKIERLLS